MSAAEMQRLAEAVRAGDRRALAKAITLIESTRADHRDASVELLQQLAAHTGKAVRLGVSGAPGVGKSTFIETLGKHVLGLGHRPGSAGRGPLVRRQRWFDHGRQDPHAGACQRASGLCASFADRIDARRRGRGARARTLRSARQQVSMSLSSRRLASGSPRRRFRP